MTGHADEFAVLEKLKKMVDEGDLPQFTGDEAATIRRMIETYEGFEAMGKLGGATMNILKWFGFMVGGYLVVKGVLGDWVQHVAGK